MITNVPPKTGYQKIVGTRGFASLVERAREEHLGLSPGSSFPDLPADSQLDSSYPLAGWTILDLLDLPGSAEPFVMNAVAFGIADALQTKVSTHLRVLVPETPKAVVPFFKELLSQGMESVERDVRGGFVTMKSARRDYGVAMDVETLKVDVSGTDALRRDLRRAREAPKLFHRFIYFDDEEEEFAWVQEHFPR